MSDVSPFLSINISPSHSFHLFFCFVSEHKSNARWFNHFPSNYYNENWEAPHLIEFYYLSISFLFLPLLSLINFHLLNANKKMEIFCKWKWEQVTDYLSIQRRFCNVCRDIRRVSIKDSRHRSFRIASPHLDVNIYVNGRKDEWTNASHSLIFLIHFGPHTPSRV